MYTWIVYFQNNNADFEWSVPIDLSKAFNCILHVVLIAALDAYGFE